MAAYTIYGVGTITRAAGGTVSPPWPSGWVSSSMAATTTRAIYATTSYGGSSRPSTPAGWTAIDDNTSAPNIAVYTKIVASGDTSPPTVVWGVDCYAVVVLLQGDVYTTDATLVVSGEARSRASTNTNQLPYPSLIPSLDNSWVLAFGMHRKTALSNGATIGTLTGFTALSSSVSSGTTLAVWAGYQQQTAHTTIAINSQTVSIADNSANSQGVLIALKTSTSTAPAITDVDGDNIITSTQANVVITGTTLGATQGTGGVTLIDGLLTQSLSVDSWAATSIQVDITQGNIRNGARTVQVTTGTGTAASKAITLTPPSGTSYVDITSLRALTLDSRNKPTRLYSSPDITGVVQVEYKRTAGSGSITVGADGRVGWDDTVTQMQWRWHNGSVWSSWYTWDLRGFFPDFIGPNIPDVTFVRNVAIATQNYGALFVDQDSVSGTYTISPTIPTGLAINSGTGAVTGTPTVSGTYGPYLIRRTDSETSYDESDPFMIIVEDPPNAPTFSGLISDFSNEINVAMVPFDASPLFKFVTTYALIGAPPGIGIDPSTGSITGTPTANALYPTLIVTGTNAYGTASSNPFSFDVFLHIDPTPTATVPNVVGKTLDAATVDILAAGFALGSTARVANALTLGLVFAQVPPANSVVTAGSSISLSLSLGPEAEPPPPFIPPVLSHRPAQNLRRFLLG